MLGVSENSKGIQSRPLPLSLTLFLSFSRSLSLVVVAAAAGNCTVEFSWTIGTITRVKLSKTWSLCSRLAGLCVPEPSGVNRSWVSQAKGGLNAHRTQSMTKESLKEAAYCGPFEKIGHFCHFLKWQITRAHITMFLNKEIWCDFKRSYAESPVDAYKNMRIMSPHLVPNKDVLMFGCELHPV